MPRFGRMESSVEGHTELQALCANVESWLELQAREASMLMADVATAHEDVLAGLASAASWLEAEVHLGPPKQPLHTHRPPFFVLTWNIS